MVKQYIPLPLRRMLSRGKTYHQRLHLLRQMKSQIEGKTDADADILRRSFSAGPRDLLKQLDVYRYPTLLEDATVRVRGFGTFKVRGRTDDLAHIMPSFQKSVMDTAKKFAKGHLDFSPFSAVQGQSGGLKPAGSGFLGCVAA